MKIILKGFRCHTDSEFEFDNGSLILISGSSGIGKTTIFQAIYWVLYGSLRNIYDNTGNSPKCNVTLKLNKFEIYRQGKPNLLRITLYDSIISYEDAIAQQLINQNFGIKEIWKACCYLDQNSRCGLLMGSNIERMELLNNIAFLTDDPEACISRIDSELKEIQKKFNDVQISFQTEYDLFANELTKNPIDPSIINLITDLSILYLQINNYKLDLAKKEQELISLRNQELEQQRLVGIHSTKNKILLEKKKELEILNNNYDCSLSLVPRKNKKIIDHPKGFINYINTLDQLNQLEKEIIIEEKTFIELKKTELDQQKLTGIYLTYSNNLAVKEEELKNFIEHNLLIINKELTIDKLRDLQNDIIIKETELQRLKILQTEQHELRIKNSFFCDNLSKKDKEIKILFNNYQLLLDDTLTMDQLKKLSDELKNNEKELLALKNLELKQQNLKGIHSTLTNNLLSKKKELEKFIASHEKIFSNNINLTELQINELKKKIILKEQQLCSSKKIEIDQQKLKGIHSAYTNDLLNKNQKLEIFNLKNKGYIDNNLDINNIKILQNQLDYDKKEFILLNKIRIEQISLRGSFVTISTSLTEKESSLKKITDSYHPENFLENIKKIDQEIENNNKLIEKIKQGLEIKKQYDHANEIFRPIKKEFDNLSINNLNNYLNLTDEDIWQIKENEKSYHHYETMCQELGILYNDDEIKKKIKFHNNIIQEENIIIQKINLLYSIISLEKKLEPIKIFSVTENDVLSARDKLTELKKGFGLLLCPLCNGSVRYSNNILIKGETIPSLKKDIESAQMELDLLTSNFKKTQDAARIKIEIENILSKLGDRKEIEKILENRSTTDIQKSILYNNDQIKKLSSIIIIPKKDISSDHLAIILNYLNYKKNR